MKKVFKRISIILTAVIAIAVFAVGIYANDFYRTDAETANAIANYETLNENSDIQVEQRTDMLIITPKEADTGLVFYPGGKVEYTAYYPLMEQLAQKGIASVIVKMPLNLAVLDVNAADGVQNLLPNVEKWYIGGHSLGGSMAASYLSKNTEAYDGLIMLASYSTADLSATEIDVISVYGTEDGVLNMESYDKYISNLPSDTKECIIAGGNHAGFGSYGKQEGDGEMIITPSQQIEATMIFITDWLNAIQ